MSFAETLGWYFRSSFKNSKPWRMVEAALKSPSIPLYSKGEASLQDSNPSLEKGKGRFLGGVREEYVANFWVRTLARD
jgi:hypothetical protein